MAIKQRLEQLEKNDNRQEPLVIIRTTVDMNREPIPAIGYHIGSEQLLRLDGESNEELQDRACAAIRAQAPGDARVLVLSPIHGDDPDDS